MQQQCLVRSFNSWVNFCTARKCAKLKVMELLVKATTRQRCLALRKWFALAQHSRAQSEALERVLKYRHRRTLRTALATWRSTIHLLVNARLSELERFLHIQSNKVTSLEVEKERAKDATLRRIINSWKNRSLLATFTCWKKNVVNQKLVRKRSGRVLQRILHTELSRAFEGWVTFVSARKDQRKRVHKVLCRLACAKLTLAFEHWQQFLLQGKRIEDFIQRRSIHLITRCFDALDENCKVRCESKREVVRRLIGASKQRRQRCFNWWRLQAEAARVQEKYLQVLTVATAIKNEQAMSLKTLYCWRRLASKSKLRRCHLSHLFMSKGRNAKLKSVRQWKAMRLRAHVLQR